MAQSYAEAKEIYIEWMKGELHILTEKLGLGFQQVPRHHLDWLKVYFMLEAVERKQKTDKELLNFQEIEPLGYPSKLKNYVKSASLNSILKNKRRLIITGVPGSGKTTSLLYLISSLIHPESSEKFFQGSPIPVFLQLKQIAPYVGKDQNISSIITNQFERCEKIEDAKKFYKNSLAKHDLWLLLDGMDEVPSAQKEKVLTSLLGWMNTYREISCILTSRPEGDYNRLIGGDWHLSEYSLCSLKSDEDIIAFIQNWLVVLDPKQGQKKALDLFNILKDRKGIKNALRNPLLLRMMGDIFSLNKYEQQKLPWSRSEIYESYIDGPILEKADISSFPDYSKELAFQILEYIAWYVHGEKRELSQIELIRRLKKYFPQQKNWDNWFTFFCEQMRILYAIEDPSKQQGGWCYVFSHRTFQEFFVARKIASICNNGKRGRNWIYKKALRNRLWDSHWREVILLFCSMIAGGSCSKGKTQMGDWFLKAVEREKVLPYYELISLCFDEGICCPKEDEKRIFQKLIELKISSSHFLEKYISIIHFEKNNEYKKFSIVALGEIRDVRAVDGLLEVLKDKGVAKEAVVALGEIGDARAVNGLLEALKDGDKEIVWFAARALRKIGDARAVDGLLEVLKDEDKEIARETAWALGEIGDARAVNGLLEALKDEDKEIARETAWGLGEIGDARAVDGLLEALRDEDKRIAWVAARALRKIGDSRAVDGLLEALKDEDKEIARETAWGLGEIGDARAVDGLLEVLKDKGVAKEAVVALGEIGDARAVNGLLEALKDNDKEIAWAAVLGLRKIGDSRAVDGLLEVLKDEDKEIARETAWALGEIGDSRAVDGLLEALKDEDKEIARETAWGLGEIGDARAVDGLLEVLKDKGVAKEAVVALGEIGDARAVNGLLEALKDGDKEIVWFAARALRKIGDARAVDGLLEVLKDEDKEIARETAWALGEIGDARAVNGLLEALKDEDKEIARETAWGLGEIGDARAVDGLLEALRDEDKGIAWVAARALRKIGDSRAVDGLLEALKDEDKEIAWVAARALEKIDYNPPLPEPELPVPFWKKIWFSIAPFILRNLIIIIIGVLIMLLEIILKQFIDRELIVNTWPKFSQLIISHPLRTVAVCTTLTIMLKEVLGKIKNT